ncbi:probable selenium-dependent hydroxylase accessory protein YqeC [Halorubrum aquaticum]|uniref:Probable selenium-dependent hydroxylase accessory protein YqeC n=1 Tax=Halorubrum aquaticum TaxID=387340 RepID=A0A1I3BZW7_9EURY|nr:selenium cofactor biosynthesis protein YqeC [Halorubrum aquaticum]SFH67898.1 probable selenium-dependent hydroxylase accessory protein YqeC [Halorubrum aquaticum]
MNVVDALDAGEGTTCLVGAGGKKTTLYVLADRLDRAVLTATVRIPIFDRQVATVRTAADPVSELASLRDRESDDERATFPLGLVPERERDDRYRGYDPETVDRLSAAHDGPVLVKADGARTRLFKAPNDREPQVPAGADTVVPVASVHAVGEPLSEAVVHRPERVAGLVDGVETGDEITPELVGRVVAHEAGGLKGVPADATAVPLLNMVDDDADEAVAREVAAAIHERADVPRVVLARMREPAVVAVVE